MRDAKLGGSLPPTWQLDVGNAEWMGVIFWYAYAFAYPSIPIALFLRNKAKAYHLGSLGRTRTPLRRVLLMRFVIKAFFYQCVRLMFDHCEVQKCTSHQEKRETKVRQQRKSI